MDEVFRPRRGDPVEAWLKGRRDSYQPSVDTYENAVWFAFDAALDDYRLRADTGAALDEDVPGGPWWDAEPRDG